MKKGLIISLLVLTVYTVRGQAPGHKSYVTEKKGAGYFPLSVEGKPVFIYTDSLDYAGVQRAANSLMGDINSVTGNQPKLTTKISAKHIVLIGTLGKNDRIDQLVRQKKVNVSAIEGRWET